MWLFDQYRKYVYINADKYNAFQNSSESVHSMLLVLQQTSNPDLSNISAIIRIMIFFQDK